MAFGGHILEQIEAARRILDANAVPEDSYDYICYIGKESYLALGGKDWDKIPGEDAAKYIPAIDTNKRKK